MERQEILRRDDPPWLVVLLDESVIRRSGQEGTSCVEVATLDTIAGTCNSE
jgi:hypothetical protein